MDIVRAVFLLVAVASQSERCWGDPPPEKPGQVITILEDKEHLQWQHRISLTSKGTTSTRTTWNEDVNLLKAWTNEVSNFHMTCAQKGDQFRAIIFITKSGDSGLLYYPVRNLDVKTCEDTLLESVTIVRRGQWKMNGEKISQIVMVKQDAGCKMDVFDAKSNTVKEVNKTCPPTNDRGSPKNGDGYVNGWKEKTSADREIFKYNNYIRDLD